MSSPPPTAQGRVIKAALLILPVGTILFGAASFGIWWWQKRQVEQRNYKFASAMRRDVTAPAIDRYVKILREVLDQPGDQRLAAVAAFLESSLGAENMGYNVRQTAIQTAGFEVVNIDAELTGKKRPREVILVLSLYGERRQSETEAHALAMMMSIAHAVAGENRQATLRFAGIASGIKDLDGNSPLQRFAAMCRDREERVMRVYVLGVADKAVLAEIEKAFNTAATGTMVQAIPATATVDDTMQAALAFQPILMSAIDN